MSTDPTHPLPAPAPPPEEAEADAAGVAPPTVTYPVLKAPPPPPPPPPAEAAPARTSEPPTRTPATPTRTPNPAPPTQTPAPPTQWGPPPGPTAWDRPPDPTFVDEAPPTRRNPQQPPQAPQPPQPPQGDRPDQWSRGWQQQALPPQQQQTPPPRQWQAPPAPEQAEQWEVQTPTGMRPTLQPAGQGAEPRLRRRQRKRRVRRSVMALFTVIVILILLVIADRVALAVTENDMASQFQKNGLPVKPSVTIEGFPFLTQLAAKDFNKVDISASNIPVSLPTGGTLSINSLSAKIDGLHISSYSSTASARVDKMNATGFVSFSALAAAGGVGNGTGLTFAPVNANTVKVTASLGGIISDSENVQITTTGPQTISVKVVSSGSGDILGSVLSSLGSYSFSLPKGLPPTLKITNLSFSSQGVNIAASATNATFSQ